MMPFTRRITIALTADLTMRRSANTLCGTQARLAHSELDGGIVLTAYRAPLPQPTPETQPFFDGLRRRKLLIQRCNDCGVAYYYPRPFCPECLSANVAWEEASGKGTLYSFVINYRSPPGFEAPYVIAVVELEEGPRMMTNLVGVEPHPDMVRCDMAVEIVFDDVTDDVTLPKFRSAEPQA